MPSWSRRLRAAARMATAVVGLGAAGLVDFVIGIRRILN
jgi:hypothetical protein